MQMGVDHYREPSLILAPLVSMIDDATGQWRLPHSKGLLLWYSSIMGVSR